MLDKRSYPVRKHLFIIGMMRKFELCFDIEPDRQFLIPDLLPKEEPYTGEWSKTLAFEYHYPVLPGSIISRFIVRMNHYIHQKTYWRSGVVLANESNLALIKADREDKKIMIRVSGKENTRRNLLTAIRSHFDYIHQTIPGIVPEAKVPLIEHPDIVLDYQELLGLESMGEKSIAIGKLQQRFPLRQLLDGIEYQTKRMKLNPRNCNIIGSLEDQPDTFLP
ncbi:MAG: COR domain-containing protein [Cyanobacteria bacterium P01_C01_bin.72]